MQPSTTSLRDRPVRHLARERVLDGRTRGPRSASTERTAVTRSRSSSTPKSGSSPPSRCTTAAVEKTRPITAPACERRLLVRGKTVDPRREHGVDGVGHRNVGVVASDHPPVLRLDEHAAVDELADELLEEERVPVGALHEQVAQLLRHLRELLLEQLRDGVDGQRVEPEDGRVALSGSPRRPDVENLRPRRGDEHRRARARSVTSRSRRSRRSGSAQWMSSTTRTIGGPEASSSTKATAAA